MMIMSKLKQSENTNYLNLNLSKKYSRITTKDVRNLIQIKERIY